MSRYSTSEKRLLERYFKEKFPNASIEEQTEYWENLEKGIPYQHLLGSAWFYDREFEVNENVLIPRPETEELLEICFEKIQLPETILEIGSGSGCIPIMLKLKYPKAQIESWDISEKAIEIARKNAFRYRTEIIFRHKDYLSERPCGQLDLLISNPPYIGLDEVLDSIVLNNEPHLALFSEDPLAFYKKLAEDAHNLLRPGGWVMVEINQRFGLETLALFSNLDSELVKDLSGNDRFILAQKI